MTWRKCIHFCPGKKSSYTLYCCPLALFETEAPAGGNRAPALGDSLLKALLALHAQVPGFHHYPRCQQLRPLLLSPRHRKCYFSLKCRELSFCLKPREQPQGWKKENIQLTHFIDSPSPETEQMGSDCKRLSSHLQPHL